MKSAAAINALGALAQEHRLALFRLLVQAGEKGMPAGAIADALGVPNSSLSFHLAQLRNAGLILQERQHRSLIYRANYAAMNALVGYLMENCCAGANCGTEATCEIQDPREEVCMKRLHVHVGVDDLANSVRFYSTLLGAEPTVVKDDYAKWMLEDPRVNFAISQGNHAKKGIEHLGIQVESTEELSEVYGRLKAADRPVLEEGTDNLLLRQVREELDRRP